MKENSFFLRFRNHVGIGQDASCQDATDSMIMCRVVQPGGYPVAPIPMCFTRRALRVLLDTVGSRPPESGAMGFSPKDSLGFDLIEFDVSGSSDSGGAVYRPSVEWSEERQNHHLNLPESKLRLWSGHLHSHPGAFAFPSGKAGKGLGDLGYVEEVFGMNEWMQWFFIPILTHTGTDEISIHPWVCRRGNPVDLFIADLRLCRNAVEFPEREFNPEWERRIAMAAVSPQESEERTSERARSGEAGQDREAEERRPFEESRPMAEGSQDTQVKPARENGVSSGEEVVVAAPRRIDPVAQRAISTYQEVAGAFYAGPTSASVPAAGKEMPDHEVLEYTKRIGSVISAGFRTKSILVIGLGAGSYAAEKLARLCPRQIKVCDFDTVELSNLSRTVYNVDDARSHRRKVDAFAQRIALVNPWVKVVTYPEDLNSMSRARVDEMFTDVDLVFAGTDDFSAQAFINEEAVAHAIPAVFIGIHAGAQGGRIVWYVPGQTPCYRCVARDRFEAAENGEHEKVNLTGETGSIFDCQFIDMIATKVGVAILERGRDSVMGRFFTSMGRRNDIVVRCDPDYGWGHAIWDAVLGDLPGEPKDFAKELKEQVLLAMDTIWLQGEWDLACPVCQATHRDFDGCERRVR